jgi:putative spermidine/putrescine transport system substrate-binding protein
LKAKYIEGLGDDVAVVIPKEASVAAPYAISLVKNGPNPDAGKLWLNFVMSSRGQAIFAEGFVRPSVPGIELPPEVVTKLPPAPQVKPLDVGAAAKAKAAIDAGWAKAALGN